MMGLEEHLIHMFREDFEFGDGSSPSHLHRSAPRGAGGSGTAVLDEPSRNTENATSYATATPAGLHAITVPEAASAVGITEEEDEVADGSIPVAVTSTSWLPSAEAELKKIPFFVRGKVRRNTEKFALDRGIGEITVDTMYDAKAFYGR
jgi:light-independent protochlorophyllide reductase subunit B